MDNLTKAQRRKNMQNIRSTNTLPERMIMKEIRKKKIYFGRNLKSLPGKPDLVFRKQKVAVFIDSDFWHHNTKKFVMPKSNKAYWEQKIRANKLRDNKVNRQLKKLGWTVIRIWESTIKKDITKCLEKIFALLN